MTKLFISDLHLDENRPDITRGFLDFMTSRAMGAEELYVLGDLFEVWLGDDHQSEFNQSVIDSFAGFEGKLFFMHGNRDFLLGDEFCHAAGGQLLDDPALIDCYGRPALLMHGDSLCTDDSEYMQVRSTLRNTEFQKVLLEKSLAERAAIARGARKESIAHTRESASDIMDVNAPEVLRLMQEYSVDLLIHGHTHRPKVHEIENKENGLAQLTRIVLGDWDQLGWVLEVSPAAHLLQSFPLKH
jgi:UDP-2,3-diacylglucosamine hydrolase